MPEKQILIVEDERIAAEDLQMQLNNLGFSDVIITSTGEEALKIAKNQPLSLALMDIMLTGELNGIKTAEQLKNEYNIPVIYITAYADKDTLEQIKKTEPYGFIVKPFDSSELQGVIETALYKYKMESKLRESEERLRSIYENTTIGLYRTDPNGEMTMANPALIQILGYANLDELQEKGKGPKGFIPCFRRKEQSLIFENKDEIKNIESSWIRPDKNQIHIRESAKTFRGDENTIKYFEGTVEDITERKTAEKEQQRHLLFLKNMEQINTAIRQSDNMDNTLENILEKVLDIFQCDRTWFIFPCDPETDTWNVPMEKTKPEYPGAFALGKAVPITEEMGQSFQLNLNSDNPVIFHPETGYPLPDSAKAFNIQSSMNTAIYPKIGKPWLWGISQCSHPRHWTDEDQTIFKEIGRRIADAISSLQFLRDLKDSEARYRNLNTELEARVRERTIELETINHDLIISNKELEAFSYSVSHDLRGPLRSINGFSQLLCEEFPDILVDRGEKYIQRIRQASDHMNDLIDDMLKLSKVTRLTLKIKTVDLTSMTEEIAQEFKDKHTHRKIDFDIANNIISECDGRLICIALRNLLDNAVKFTTGRTKSQIQIGTRKQKGEQVYFIKDNGVGFDMTYKNKLFLPFQRLHSDSQYKGSGIGLSIVQRIIQRHKGKIWAESNLGKGATFYFTINTDHKTIEK